MRRGKGRRRKRKGETKRMMDDDYEEEAEEKNKEKRENREDSHIEDVVDLRRDICHSPRDLPNDLRGYDYRLSHDASPFRQVAISFFNISGVAWIIALQIEAMNY
jgi:hypothetical protein